MSTTSTPTLKAVPEIRVVSLREIMANYRDQKRLWAKVTAFCKDHGIEIAGACFTIYYDMGYKAKDVDAEVCLPIHADAKVPAAVDEQGGIQIHTLPALPKAASITYVGGYDGLPSVYTALYSWISANSHEPSGPVREVYLKMNHEDATEGSFVTELQQPVA